MSLEESNVRALLGRVRSFAPEARRLWWTGEGEAAFLHAAESEGWEPSGRETAEAEVHCRPGEEFVGEPVKAGTVLVVARVMSGAGLPPLRSERGARRLIYLQDWVAAWKRGPRILRRLLVSPAVARRLWETDWEGQREWVFSENKVSSGVLETAKFLLVTFFGTGLSPVVPATVGSACFVPVGWLALRLGGAVGFFWTALGLAVVSSLLSLWLERWAERRFSTEDPRQFVLDEVAGLSLTWLLLPEPVGFWGILLGFALFRVFDIFKWGVSWVEKLPIRGKVLWDDLIAGLYAGLLARLLLSL